MFTDLITLPLRGDSIVVRIEGGPAPGQPRRTGHECWRHRVTPTWAADWATTNPYTDDLLVRWQSEAR